MNRKLALRRRLADYAAFVEKEGCINRSDMMLIGEISRPQASADLKALIEDYPHLRLKYDPTRKAYFCADVEEKT